jgi:hypothetical protein
LPSSRKKRAYCKRLIIHIKKPYHLSLINTMPPFNDKLLSRMGAISTRATLSDGAVVGIVFGSLLVFGGAIFIFCVSVRGQM